MKSQWKNPEVESLDINETQNSNQIDSHSDGVYIGIASPHQGASDPDHGKGNVCTKCS